MFTPLSREGVSEASGVLDLDGDDIAQAAWGFFDDEWEADGLDSERCNVYTQL